MTIISKECEGLFDGVELNLSLRQDIELFVASWVPAHVDEVFLILQFSLWGNHELAGLDIID